MSGRIVLRIFRNECEVVRQHMGRADQTGDDADDCHEAQGDQLDDGRRGLEFTGQLRRDSVDEVRTAEEEHHKRDALRADDAAALFGGDHQREIGPAGGNEYEGITRGQPAENGGKTRVIDRGHEPANEIAVAAADGCFGIVYDTVDFFILLRHRGKRQDADQHDEAADDPCNDSERHIAFGLLQNRLCLEKDA